MFCPQCAAQVETGDRFCRSCASPLNAPVPNQTAQQRPIQQSAPVTISNPTMGKNLQIVGWLIFLVCACISIFSCVAARESADGYGEGIMSMVFLLLSTVGLVIAMIGKFKHWYHAE
jgi:hypothetical protein